MKKIPVVIILSLLLFILLSNSVFAVSWWPLVPCGLNPPTDPNEPRLADEYYQSCSRCDLFRLFKNIIDFVLYGLMPPVAAILFVWGGFLILMGGANPGWITQGRTIFWNTFMGVVILSASWLITNTIIRSLGAETVTVNGVVTNVAKEWWKFECRETVGGGGGQKYACQSGQCVVSTSGSYTEPTCNNTCGAPPAQKYGCNNGNQCVADTNGPYITNNCDNQCQAPPGGVVAINSTSLPAGTVGINYSTSLSASGGTVPYTWTISTGSLPVGLSLSGSIITGTPTTAGTSTFTVRVTDNSTPQQSATKQLSIVVGGTGTSTLSISTASLPGGTANQAYSQQLAATGGTGTYSWSVSSGALPNGLSINFANGRITGTPTTAGTSTFTVRVTDNSTPQQLATKQLSIVVTTGGTLACMFNGVNYSTFNLCSGQSRPGGCGTSVCSQYLPSINKYANGAATVAVLKTFMVIESDCNIKAGTGTSYGLMQISPNTGKPLAYKCGLSPDVITPSWLTDPANADKSICLGAAIINSIAAGTCGSQPRNIYAGYNAGPGHCTASNDCAGEQSCGGGAKKKWECPFDNPQHTVCNTGMYQTKQGATYINYCLNNLRF